LLIFVEEVQAVIDQQQKNEIGEGPIDKAEKFHARVPIDSQPSRLDRM
jgi:hypothetical protein